MSTDGLPPLRDVIAAHGLAANKALGQHFLLDLNLTAKIARFAGPLDGRVVIEVGPGPGGLTRALLDTEAAGVIAVEKDPRFISALAELGGAAAGRLHVEHADALTLDEVRMLGSLAAGYACRIVSNLPYNIGTQLLIKWLSGRIWWESMTLMFQYEVAERIVARPGQPAYGRLAVLCALRAAPQPGFAVPARAFTPAPKVDSAIVRLDPIPDPYPDVAALETVTAATFGQRRKMLRRSLKQLGDAKALLDAADLDPKARPEDLAPGDFARLATAWRAATSGPGRAS